jgi:hypothetical protein
MRYSAIVLGENLIDADIPVGAPPVPWGSWGVVVHHGDAEGVSITVDASTEDYAADRIFTTWPGATIDDLQESAYQPTKTFLVHLNVEVPAGDPRTPRQVALDITSAMNARSHEWNHIRSLSIEVALAEEI